jgi:sugar phosphate isomerase/epimerase
LVQALHTISELKFHKVDLAMHETGSQLKPSLVVADPAKTIAILKKSNLSFAAFHVEIGVTDPGTFQGRFRTICRIGRHLAVPVVNIPTAPQGSDLNAEVDRLAKLNAIAEAEGVILTIETNREHLTADPKTALELCRQIPGLGITLDPSHYLVEKIPDDHYDLLYPYVRHVRLRDTAPGKFQVMVGKGQLEYARIITCLERVNYQRALAIDIHQDANANLTITHEVRKLKYLLESMT